MSLYLEVKNKKYAASTLALEPGDVARIGRGAKVEMFLPDDLTLAERHFMLVFDGFSGRVIDSESETGTFVDSKKVLTAEIDKNTIVKAGETEFAVLLESDTKTILDTPITRLVKMLQTQEKPLYCLIDASRDTKILSLLKQSNVNYQSLYQGETQEKLAHVAPYLVQFQQDTYFLEKLLRNGWGKRWFSFFTSDASFTDLRRHFRKFVFVKDERGETVYFRFYDPSILRTFLPSCNAVELEEFFGKIESFLLEDELPSNVQHFRFADSELICEPISLSN
jgi:Domain of unknown function (DUF4123)/FHA domain